MIILHVFTEEPSCKNVLDIVLPKILPENISFRIHAHQGKQDLEKALQYTLPKISRIPDSKILILRDQDNEDCKGVKNRLKEIADLSCQDKSI